MKTLFVILSSVAFSSSIVPYVIEILRGTTKPRVVSWFTWSVLAVIASAASFSDHQVPAGVLLGISAVATMLVVVLSLLKRGDRSFERIDGICLFGALVGLGLWWIFDSPAVAVVATISIDLVGCVPTLLHSWQKPHEETTSTFLLAAIGGFFTLLAAGDLRVTSIAYPLYIVVADAAVAAIIVWSPHRKLAGEPPELREL